MRYRIISRYLIREITGIFALGLTIFTMVLLMGRMVKLMEMVVSNGVPLVDVARLIAFLLPSFLVLTIPMAFLLAVMLAFGRLSSDNEITVLKSSGLSLYLLLPPVLIVALLAGAMTLFISLVAVPWGNSGFKQMTVDIASKYAANAIRERVFLDDMPGIVLYVDHYDEATRRMERVMIQDGRDPERPLTIFAKSGLITPDITSSVLRILLHNGSIHTQSTNGGYSLVSFAEYLLTAEAGRGGVVTHTETEMGVKDLFYAANAPQTEPWMRMKMLAEMHSRFAFPFAVIVFALLAVPLGLQNRRAGKTSGFTISILILLIYYVLLSFLRTFAEKGVIPPFAALWLPNLLFGAFGLALLRMAVAEKSLRDIPALLGLGKRNAA